MGKTWMTFLLISVISASIFSIAAPLHVQGSNSIPAAKNTTSSTVSDAESLAGATEHFVLEVNPQFHTVHHLKNGKNRSASYAVQVRALSGFRGEVALVAVQGTPPNSSALFNPPRGVPKPTFVSLLKVIVPSSTPAGVYNLTIFGASGRYMRNATTTLIVEGEPSSPTIPQEHKRLRVTVSTDKENYQIGEPVIISGYASLGAGRSFGNVNVSLTVVDPSGVTIHNASVTTSQIGFYSENFTLSSNAREGTYTVFSAASLSGYPSSIATVTFVVGETRIPSVRIVDISVTLLNDTLSSEFHPGETVVIWTAVNSTGAALVDGNTWIEVLDPNNRPISVVTAVVTINAGAQERIGIHVILPMDASVGTYTVRILVSDGPISAGGKFLDSEEIAFIVTSPE